MSKRILLIDSDESFAQGLSSAINARGFVATTATNSEQGMTLARTESPDLIVVCVEAQPTNGYMLCTRLKKDDQLKGIPVILTSANATPDSFEKHKKLKTRAEDYLIKPFAPQTMLEKAASLLGVQLPAEQHEEEIVSSVEDEPLGLGDLVQGEDEPISLSEEDAQQAHSAGAEEAVVVEEVEEVQFDEAEQHEASAEDDLEMFDQAFDNLAPAGASKETAGDEEKAFGALRLAPEPSADEAPVAEPEVAHEHEPTELTAPDDEAVLHGLIHEGDAPANETAAASAEHEYIPPADDGRVIELEQRLAELEQRLAERDAELEQARKGSATSGDLLKAREAKTKADREVLKLKEELHAREKELVELQEQQGTLEAQAQQLKDDAVKREGAAKALQQRADALAAAAKKFERELGQAREELKTASAHKARVAELEKTVGAHDELKKKHEDLSKQFEEHRTRADQLSTELAGAREMHAEELESARADAGKIQLEVEQAQEELKKAQDELKAAQDAGAAAKKDADAVRHELDGARLELESVKGDMTALTGEKEMLAEERDGLRKQLEEAQAAAATNEERAVKAYQQIKEGEKLREKARQALQIALRLLEENATAEDAAAALDKAG